ncbi:hypothetical protein M8818_000036 [Zalaria obscura]|uniref:Uncharacterized protein n=1 Tax=Zalaria obscura TaxID=2024903 RepID=A0ACC3SNH4_9PEZI
MSSSALRSEVIRAYKGTNCLGEAMNTANSEAELLYLGREYPLGYNYFKPRLHEAFAAKANVTDEEEIRKGLAQAEYVKKELEAM